MRARKAAPVSGLTARDVNARAEPQPQRLPPRQARRIAPQDQAGDLFQMRGAPARTCAPCVPIWLSARFSSRRLARAAEAGQGGCARRRQSGCCADRGIAGEVNRSVARQRGRAVVAEQIPPEDQPFQPAQLRQVRQRGEAFRVQPQDGQVEAAPSPRCGLAREWRARGRRSRCAPGRACRSAAGAAAQRGLRPRRAQAFAGRTQARRRPRGEESVPGGQRRRPGRNRWYTSSTHAQASVPARAERAWLHTNAAGSD